MCNFYVGDRIVCGLLSGFGVVIVVSFVVVVVGIEIDGLVVCLLLINGLVGLKFMFGLVSCIYVVLISYS